MQSVHRSGRNLNMKKRGWVELRCLHQTQHAAEGVRTRDASGINVPEECAQRKSTGEFSALLRQEDRKLRWLAPVQAGVDLIPGGRLVSPRQPLLETQDAIAHRIVSGIYVLLSF